MSKHRSAGGHEKPVKGATNEWYTPQYILDALGPFDDDPARPGRIDGLTRAWNGLVWLNPPYGPECGTWLNKLADHGSGVALVFARTETKWFGRAVWERASALRFLQGRISFMKNGEQAKGNSGAPSVLVAYGDQAVGRLIRCRLPGFLITEWIDL